MKKAGLILFVLFALFALFKFTGNKEEKDSSGERQTPPDEPSFKKGDKRGGEVKVYKKGQTRGGK